MALDQLGISLGIFTISTAGLFLLYRTIYLSLSLTLTAGKSKLPRCPTCPTGRVTGKKGQQPQSGLVASFVWFRLWSVAPLSLSHCPFQATPLVSLYVFLLFHLGESKVVALIERQQQQKLAQKRRQGPEGDLCRLAKNASGEGGGWKLQGGGCVTDTAVLCCGVRAQVIRLGHSTYSSSSSFS